MTLIWYICHGRPDLLRANLPSVLEWKGDADVVVIDKHNDPAVRIAARDVAPGVRVISGQWRELADAINALLPTLDGRVAAATDRRAETLIVWLDDVRALGPYQEAIETACERGAWVGLDAVTDNWLTEIDGVPFPYVTRLYAARLELWHKMCPLPTDYLHWFIDVEMSLKARELGREVAVAHCPFIDTDGLTVVKVDGRDVASGVAEDLKIYQQHCADRVRRLRGLA